MQLILWMWAIMSLLLSLILFNTHGTCKDSFPGGDMMEWIAPFAFRYEHNSLLPILVDMQLPRGYISVCVSRCRIPIICKDRFYAAKHLSYLNWRFADCRRRQGQLADEFNPPRANCCLINSARTLADQLQDWNQLGRYH